MLLIPIILSAHKALEELQRCVDQWHDYEELKEKCAVRLQDVATKLQRIELQSSLTEKEQTLDRLKVEP